MSPQRGDGIDGWLISFNATFPSRASTSSRFRAALLPLQLLHAECVVGLQRANLVAPPVVGLLGNLRFPAASALPGQVMPSSRRPDDQASTPTWAQHSPSTWFNQIARIRMDPD
jgi:hypothetical protein